MPSWATKKAFVGGVDYAFVLTRAYAAASCFDQGDTDGGLAQLFASIGLLLTIRIDMVPGFEKTAIPEFFEPPKDSKTPLATAASTSELAEGEEASLLGGAGGAAKEHTLWVPTMILDMTMWFAALMDFFNGFEIPCDGHKFRTGSSEFGSVYSTLELAEPDPRDWDGPAEVEYDRRNTELQSLVQQMQSLDQQMQDAIASQGDLVLEAHRAVALSLASMVGARGVALLLYFLPDKGPEASFVFQAAVAAAIIVVIAWIEERTRSHAERVADTVGELSKQYVDVAAEALRIAHLPWPDPVAVNATRFAPSVVPDVPAVGALVGLPAASASVGVRQAPVLAATPAMPVSTPAAVLSSSGPAFQLGPAVNQNLEPVSAVRGRQARGGATPTERPVPVAVAAGADVHAAHASAGALAAGRAPTTTESAGAEAPPAEEFPLERSA